MSRAQRIAPPATAFRLSHDAKKRPRIKHEQHLSWIRQLPCLVTGRRDGVEAAHIRYADIAFGKRQSGLGERPDDRWVVPLQASQHRDQHAHGEKSWWELKKIDPLTVALALYNVSGDDQAALGILDEARKRRLPHSPPMREETK